MSDQPIFADAISAPAFFNKDSQINDEVTGTVSHLSFRQSRDYKTNEPEVWSDGTKKFQYVVTVDTDLRQFDGDDGRRSIFIKWWGDQRKDIAKAVAAAGLTEPRNGDRLTALFTGLGEPADAKSDPPKLYQFTYTNAETGAEGTAGQVPEPVKK